MSIQRNRERLGVRGLGKLLACEVLPTPGSFADLGYLDETNWEHAVEMEEVRDENGDLANVLERSSADRLSSNLLQVGSDEIDFIRNASGKVHSLRYFGLLNEYLKFQYYCIEQAKIDPSVARRFIQGKQALPLKATAIKQGTLAYDVPTIYFSEVAGQLYLDNLQIWLTPRRGYNALTAMVLDISGFARHGTLTSAFATIWQTGTPERFLRFDGTVDALNLGNILNDDGTIDFMIETWVKTPAADGTAQEILGKKNLISNHTAGFALWRTVTTNTISFKISDGAASATVVSAATVLQNVMTHIAIAVDRNGNGRLYINGAASGNAVSVASIGTSTNTLSFYLGAVNGTEFGQWDMSDTRVHRYASGLPSDIATQILSHYTAERTIHGV